AIAATTSAWSVAKPAAPRSTAPSRLSRPARDPNATEPEELDAAADQFGRRAAWTDRRRQPRPERLRGDTTCRGRRREVLSESRMRAIPPVVCPAKAGMFSRRKACRGKSQKPRSLDSRVAGNQDSEAYRQRLPREDDESPGRNDSERESGLESA